MARAAHTVMSRCAGKESHTHGNDEIDDSQQHTWAAVQASMVTSFRDQAWRSPVEGAVHAVTIPLTHARACESPARRGLPGAHAPGTHITRVWGPRQGTGDGCLLVCQTQGCGSACAAGSAPGSEIPEANAGDPLHTPSHCFHCPSPPTPPFPPYNCRESQALHSSDTGG